MPPPLPPEPAPEPTAAAPEHPAGLITTEISANRHDRRVLERRRRKYDKFVTPQGTAPVKVERQPRAPRIPKVEVIVPDDPVDDAELRIAETHHENRDELVAYKEAELYGEFNFRDTILQQLERYFVYIERMKKQDPDAYGFYREMGATILPYICTGAWDRDDGRARREKNKGHVTPLADWFHKTRPGFGCFVYGADPETERYEQDETRKLKDKRLRIMVPKFMYFRKYKMPPPEVQMISGGDVYTMTVYWDQPFDKKFKWGVPQEFGIFVSADGKEVIALKHLERSKTRIHTKKGHDWFSIPTKEWRIGSAFEEWAKDQGEDCNHFLVELFKDSIMHSETAKYAMAQVLASKGGITAKFGVNIHRTSYFFADRDYELTVDGKRKRIFHFVRPHTRSDGSTVKAHFRGEKKFSWAGYEVEITVPGRDFAYVEDIDIGAVDEHWQEKGKKYLTLPETGKKIRGWMRDGAGKIS